VLISHHDHESISVKDGRATVETGQSGTILINLVSYFATLFDIQGHAWIIIYYTSACN